MSILDRFLGRDSKEKKVERTIIRSASYVNYDDVIGEWVKRLTRCAPHKIKVSWNTVNGQVRFQISTSKKFLKCVSQWLGAKVKRGKIEYRLPLATANVPQVRSSSSPANAGGVSFSAA